MPMGAPKRGSYRCGICAINYPIHKQFTLCPICEERTSTVSNAEPHKDWLDRVTEILLGDGVPSHVPEEWSVYGDPPQEA